MQKKLHEISTPPGITCRCSTGQNNEAGFFNEKRFVCNNEGGKGKAGEVEKVKEAPGLAPSPEPITKRYEENEKKLKEGAEYNSNPEKTAEVLAMGTKPHITGKEILARMIAGYNKLTEEQKKLHPKAKPASFDVWWNNLGKQKTVEGKKMGPCKRVSIEKTENGWQFLYFDTKNEKMFPPMSAEGVPIGPAEKPAEKEKPAEAKETPGIAIEAPPSKDVLITPGKQKIINEIAPNPQPGDKIIIFRYGSVNRARSAIAKGAPHESRYVTQFIYLYDAKRKGFILEGTKNKLSRFIQGDVVRYVPAARREALERKPSLKVEIAGEEYTRIGKVRLKPGETPNYGAIANKIYKNADNGIVDPVVRSEILRTATTEKEFADLIEKAHTAVGKGNIVPIVMPKAKEKRITKRMEERMEKREKAQAKKLAEARRKGLEKYRGQWETNVKIAFNKAAPEANVKSYAAKYERGEIDMDDFLSEIDDDFSTDGIRRNMDEGVTALVQDIDAWRDAWNNNKLKGLEEVKSTLQSSPIFAPYNTNPDAARDKIYEAIIEDRDDRLYPADLIDALGIKMPGGKDYDVMQAQLLIDPKTKNPKLRKLYQEALQYVMPLEKLTNYVSELRVGRERITAKYEKANLLHERTKIEEYDETGKGMKLIIDTLGPEKSSTIKKLPEPNEDVYYCDITYQGRPVTILIDPPGTSFGKWDIYVTRQNDKLNFEKKSKQLHHSSDSNAFSSFNAEEHVNEIRQNILLMPAVIEYSVNRQSVRLMSVDMKKFGKNFRSIQELEQLSSQRRVPGFPLDVITSENAKYHERLLRVADSLNLNTDQIGITDEGLKGIMDNDFAIANLRYKGRNVTVKIDGSDVYVANGFNNTEFPDEEINGPFDEEDVEPFIKEFEKQIFKFNSNVRTMTAAPAESGIIPSRQVVDAFNRVLRQSVNNDPRYDLNYEQLLELIFSLYDFEDLKRENCLRQVYGSPNRFVIVRLPSKLATPNKTIARAAYAIKFPHAESRDKIEVAQESVDKNQKYLRNLYKIFPGASRFDRNGRRLFMEEIRATEQPTEDAEDIFYQRYSDDAAFNILYDRVKERKANGEEVINVQKANNELTLLYRKGLGYLEKLERQGMLTGKYKSMKADLDKTPALRNARIDVNEDIHKWYIEVIRLGFVQREAELEAVQEGKINEFREQMLREIKGPITEAVREKDPSITEEQVDVALKQFPVGILITYFNTVDENGDRHNIFGLHIPIVIPLNDKVNLAFMPGVTTDGRLSFGFGLSGTAEASERVNFIGGFSVGVSAGEGGPDVGFAVRGAVEFKIYKADEEGNWNHYLGISGALGATVKDGFKFSVGPYYKWKIDAQNKFNNELDEKFTELKIKEYTDRLKRLKTSPNAAEYHRLANDIRNNPELRSRLNLPANATDAQTIAAFKDYVRRVTYEYWKEFDLPTIAGGQIDVTLGTMVVTSAATGNVPMIIATSSTFLIAALVNLDIVIDEKVSMLTTQETSEQELALFENLQVRETLNRELAKSFSDTRQVRQQLETAGRLSLDEKGYMRTGPSYNGDIEDLEVGSHLMEYNEKLANVGLRLEKDPRDRIYITYLPQRTPENVKLMIGRDIAVYENGQLYLKNPNAIDRMYFYRNNRYYPFETASGASKESVILLSGNRFFTETGQFELPSQITLVKQHGESRFTPEVDKSKGEALAYTGETAFSKIGTLKEIRSLNSSMEAALGRPVRVETQRENLAAMAADIYKWRNSKGETFLKITNQDGRRVIERPSFEKEHLFRFFDEYAQAKGIEPPFNGSEKESLMIELSVLRYTKLPGNERVRYHRRLEWCRDFVLKPTFEERLKTLTEQGLVTLDKGQTIKKKAAELAQHAIDDVWNLSLAEAPTKLPDGTSTAVAVGRYGAEGYAARRWGLHQLLNGGMRENPYGYVMSKDYTEALSTRQPKEDYELALVLRGQLTPLQDIDLEKPLSGPETREFMNSPLARKVASLNHLIFVIGKDNYEKIARYYENPSVTPDNTEALKVFINIIKQIRRAQENEQSAVGIKGMDGLNYIFTLDQKIQAGIFNKCANYAVAYIDDIGILPPTPAAVHKIVVGRGESRTTVSTKLYKEFMTLFGGVAGGVALPGGGGGGPAEPTPAPEGEVEIEIPAEPGRPTDPNAQAPATTTPESGGADVG